MNWEARQYDRVLAEMEKLRANLATARQERDEARAQRDLDRALLRALGEERDEARAICTMLNDKGAEVTAEAFRWKLLYGDAVKEADTALAAQAAAEVEVQRLQSCRRRECSDDDACTELVAVGEFGPCTCPCHQQCEGGGK